MDTHNIKKELLKEFEERFEMKNFALYSKKVDIPATTTEIESFLTSYADQLVEGVVEQIATVKINRAHTYGSENADVYRAHDAGQEQMKQRIINALKSNL